MFLRQIFDPGLAQYAYLLGCQKSGEALVIDPLRDIEQYKTIAKQNNLRITAVAETHIHADFVSGAQEFAADPTIHLYLSGEGGPDWNYRWPGSRPNTHFLKHGEHFHIGNIIFEAVHTPGHTPEHMSFLTTDRGSNAEKPIALATGDFLFVSDVGRPDLLESAAGQKNVMEPSARRLQKSLSERLKNYEDYIQILPGHGAGSACGKALGAVPTTTLGYERLYNSPLKLALENEEAFVKDILSGQPEPPLYFATMKRVNRDGIAVLGAVRKVPQLSAKDLLHITAEEKLQVLDARRDRAAFDKAHFPRSLFAPFGGALFSSAAGSLLQEKDSFLLLLEDERDLEPALTQLYRIGLDGCRGWALIEELASANLLTAQIRRIAFDQFEADQAQGEGLILDVRTSAEYAQSHLEQALSIPYTRLASRIQEIPSGERLFVHCASGMRAAIASSYLQAKGYDVTHIDGSFDSRPQGACQVAACALG